MEPSTSAAVTGGAGGGNPLSGGQKQSFLSKFARTEVKSSKSVERTTNADGSNQVRDKNNSSSNNNNNNNNNIDNNIDNNTIDLRRSFNYETTVAQTSTSAQQPAAASVFETECDKALNTLQISHKFPTRGSGTIANKSLCELGVSKEESVALQRQHAESNGDDDNSNNNNNNNNNNDDDDDNDDDSDQVLPVWPSRMDAAALRPSLVQHQVYSLKDYSQVSGPTESVASSNVASSSGRLLKSMSQDRKVDTRTKRMSESVLSGVGTSGLYSASIKSALESRQRNPSIINKMTAINLTTSMGPAASVNSLLPANKNFNLLGESRIDRMRKLFVSPLSLRGASGSTKPSLHQAQSSSSRLSLQAGANMLNKPHHLMHAMYRTRMAAGSHHSRRSPMRQKQGNMKGFRVYGCPLSMANTMYPITCFGRAEIYKQQSVPYILARLCNYIEENSSQLTHEGIFRVSGNARLMEKLKTLFDHLGDAPLESESVDVATSASMLKMYLRELPEPLIPTRMNHYFFTLAKKYASYLSKSNPNGSSKTSDTQNNSGPLESSSISDTQSSFDRQRLAFLRDLTKLVRKLPIENYNLLRYLTCFLHRVALKQQSNKMSAEALGIVFGPNVFRIRSESYKGLKEQELSNQIVASVISNYKLIFDCELTDPLGNIITSEENTPLDGDAKSKKIGPATDRESEDKSRFRNIASSSGIPSIIPSTSADTKADKQEQCSRLARRKARALPDNDFYDSDDSDDDDVDDDDDDDENEDEPDFDDLDEDEECDDDGSYSPFSGSGSYCSSPASDSVESVYEGDIEADQYEDGIPIGSADTSSRCGSETSYTPSSSHSESDQDVDEISSSDFSSSPSPTKALEGLDNDATNVEAPAPSENPCRVCKRRESAQIERLEASRLREQLASKNSVQAPSAANAPDSAISHQSDEQQDIKNLPSNQGREINTRARNRSSTHKRRSDGSKRAANAKKDAPCSAATSTKADSELALDRKESPLKLRSEEKLSRMQLHPQRHVPHKQSVLRRRSSSASSLLQITDRHALRKRSAGRDDQHTRLRAHADRKGYTNDSRAYNRKSRNRSHLHHSRASQHHKDPETRASESKARPEWSKGDCYIPELIAMNLPSDIRKDLVWNYVSSSFLEVSDADRYFQLRPCNSDETLLRSQEAEMEMLETQKSRRRFSGQDFVQANTAPISVVACPQFSEIYESFEDENSSGEIRSMDRLSELQPGGLSRSAVAGVESSVISLLGDQMTSFKHSKLSLDEETDPMVSQLKVAKDFIKVLRKLLKHAAANGFHQNMFDQLILLLGHSGAENDEFNSCYVDYITGRGTVIALDNLRRDLGDDLPSVDKAYQERLERLLSFTITNLKKRYNNLKYIREHFHRHHRTGDPSNVVRSTRTAESGSDYAKTNDSMNHVQRQSMGEASSDQEPSEGSALTTPTYVGCKVSGQAMIPITYSHKDRVEQATCKFGSLCPVEFVFEMEKQLASRRTSGGRLEQLDEMSLAQIQSEKLELQKNLLRYEHWFGRPTTRSEFDLVRHLYERYRAIKIIKQKKQAQRD